MNTSLISPVYPRILGILGLVPFIALALTIGVVDGEARGNLLFALAAYGAVILSFLGGIHWGLVLKTAPGHPISDQMSRKTLIAGIAPSLLAWAGLLTWDQPTGLAVLVGGFLVVLVVDQKMVREGIVPDWYISLRMTLTIVVVLSLLAGYLL